MTALPTNLRRQLETAIKQARKIAEGGARKALEALAVSEPDPYRHMDDAQRDLRRKLRAQAKQLGDADSQTRRGAYEIKHLAEKLAYDQWHRLLFARFLLENNLLIYPEHGVSVSLDDCEELAPSLGLKDAWAVAARFAAKELPEIFRADDPAGAVELPIEDRKPLIQFVTELPVEVFTASDSLGWCYQFWQAERKKEVNDSGNKIGADELPAVTQLFTEDYMVDFLLDNTLGAWHAGRVLASDRALAETAQGEDELRSAVALPRCPWKYLRFVKLKDGTWIPAAGPFAGWPRTAKELTCLDPCMGSGHFVVAMFERLVALRMAEKELDEAAAVAAVICDNLFGLEIDPRCTQIGAFNLALAAWRRVGHCTLPPMNLACSGLAPNAKQEEWLKLADGDEKLRNGMERLYALFKEAPVLGSLINPRLNAEHMFVADYRDLQPLMEKALAQETKDDIAHEMAVTARGLAKAAEILASQFTLVATNVPYLVKAKQCSKLRLFCESYAKDASTDLATVFLNRCADFCVKGGTNATVTPQNWLYIKSYTGFRRRLLAQNQFCHVAAVGSGATATASWDVVRALAIVTVGTCLECNVTGIETNAVQDTKRSGDLKGNPLICVSSKSLLQNPDSRIALTAASSVSSELPRLATYAECLAGIMNGDSPKFIRNFWELPRKTDLWAFLQSTVSQGTLIGGLENVVLFDETNGHLREEATIRRIKLHNADEPGNSVWGRPGVAISQMSSLPASRYFGDKYDSNIAAIVPRRSEDLAAIWAFCSSEAFYDAVRAIDRKLNVTNATFGKVPIDLGYWKKVAAEKYPHGLPKPFSSDSTQWLFNGHPKGSHQPLHVAVARLLGYQWPRQTGSTFPDCAALESDGLEQLAASDGIVCLCATKSEAPGAERLRRLLVQALGKFDLAGLIARAGPKGSASETLEDWLRDEFFEQHCVLFHHRPFIWQIWDGHKNGFSALVNNHQLTHANLQKLNYAYLGDWIRRQQAAVDAGEAGSDARLQAAKQLQSRLKLILEGEPPYDIFVRWKAISKQTIGWHPDINDGVRMNIRPFATADILRKRVKIKWEKDRGKEPVRDKEEFPWFWGWDEKKQDFAGGRDFDGNRWNDCHYSIEFKRAARRS
jgi:hypothetical protein